MINKNWKLKLYLIETNLEWILYLLAALIIFIPILIVLITDHPFSSFHSNLFINTSIAFLMLGKLISTIKKTIRNSAIPWGSIGTLIALFIIFIQGILEWIL